MGAGFGRRVPPLLGQRESARELAYLRGLVERPVRDHRERENQGDERRGCSRRKATSTHSYHSGRQTSRINTPSASTRCETIRPSFVNPCPFRDSGLGGFPGGIVHHAFDLPVGEPDRRLMACPARGVADRAPTAVTRIVVATMVARFKAGKHRAPSGQGPTAVEERRPAPATQPAAPIPTAARTPPPARPLPFLRCSPRRSRR